MRHPAALLALVLTSASLTAVATASTPSGSTVALLVLATAALLRRRPHRL